MKIKRLVAGLTSLIMLGSLAGCGAKTPDELTNENGGTTNAAIDGDDNGADNGGNENGGADSEDESGGDAADSSVKYDADYFAELYGTNGEPIQLTVFSQLANYSGKLTGWFAEVMKREFNVEMTIIPDTNGMFDTRMEAGNLGDIVVIGSGEQYQRAAKEGLLFDWNDDDILTDYGPYVKAHMPYALENNANLNESIGADHVVYGFGHNVAESTDDHEAFFYTMDLRWDLYKELGYPSVKTIDDLFDLFVEMKKIQPKDENGNESYAISMWPDWDGTLVMYVKSFATCYWGYEGDMGCGHYDVDTGEFFYALDDGSPYLQSLKFFNRLYQAGLIDPNSMTQTYNEMIEKLRAGGVFYSIFDYAGSQEYNSEKHLEEGKGMYPLIPGDATPLCYGMNVLGGNRLWTIGANTEYPELCMAIINYLCTPEGYMTYWYGPKDLCWYYDEEGYTHFTELGELAYKDKKGTTMPDEWGGGNFSDGTFQANNTTWVKDAPNPDSNGETYNCENWASRLVDTKYEIFQDWRNYSGQPTMQKYMDSSPHKVAVGTSFTDSKKDADFKIIWEQVTKCIVTYSWQAIYASSDEEYDRVVDEMRQKVKDYDPDELCRAFSYSEAERRHALEEEARK